MPDPSDNLSPKTPDPPTSFWAELKRRKVMRVAITYAVVAWLIIQIASTTFGDFGIPVWAFRFVVIMLGLFFPVALIITWAFELTPEGSFRSELLSISLPQSAQSPLERTQDTWTRVLLGTAFGGCGGRSGA